MAYLDGENLLGMLYIVFQNDTVSSKLLSKSSLEIVCGVDKIVFLSNWNQ